MRSRLVLLIVLAGAACTLAGCRDQTVERLATIKESVCACKTASCAEQEIKRVPGGQIESTHRTQRIARDMMDCLARLQAAERPTTDPDAEEPGEESEAPAAAPASPAATGPRTTDPASAGTR